VAALNTRLARVFLLCAVPLSLAYALINPPYTGNEEDAHFAHVQATSHGQLWARDDEQGRYLEVPASLSTWAEQAPALLEQEGARVDAQTLWQALSASEPEGPRARLSLPGHSVIPVAYALQVPAAGLGRALGLSTLGQLYAARLASLVTFTLLSAWAVALAGELGWLFVVLGLTPMALMQASFASLDGITNGLALLFFALLLRTVLNPALSLRAPAVLALAGVAFLLTACKPFYLFCALALFSLAPNSDKPRARLYPGLAALLGSLLLLGVWCVLDPLLLEPFQGGSFRERVTWPLLHPWRTLVIAGRTLFKRGDDALIQMFGVRDILSDQLRFLSSAIAASELGLLVSLSSGALYKRLSEDGARAFSRWLGLCVGACLLTIVFSVYLSSNKLAPRFIEHVHGRYFFPLLPALCLAFAARSRPFATRWLTKRPHRRVLLPILALHVWCVLSLGARFYLSATLEFPY
jgi:uncharacterized membrane protein